MKILKLIALSYCLMSVSACVTTRSQLNRAHDESSSPSVENTSSVNSETIETNRNTNNSRAPQQASSGGYSLEETKAMVASLSGRLEELEQKVSKTGENSEAFKKLQVRVEEIEKKLAEPVSTPTPVEDKDYFGIAKNAFEDGKYDNAISAFEEYFKNPIPATLEDAILMKGESHFKQKNFKKAIVEFSKIPEKFSKSNHHPKALMRIAESFEGLGMKEDSKAFYSDLVEKFPKSPEGKAAKKRLSTKKK